MKQKFGEKTKVLLAIGGFGALFNESSTNETVRSIFAKNICTMLSETQADGVDIDWEYPGGNGADYLVIPNSAKISEIETFPLLLDAIRAEIGTEKLLTIAVPGKLVDMIAYTAATVPKIAKTVDYFHLMTYDLMNRRENVTKHHSSVAGSLETVDRYLSLGLPAAKTVLGFAYYAKWFTTDPASDCATKPIGCATVAMEDPQGNDNGRSGAFTFEAVNMLPKVTPKNLTMSPDATCGGTTGYTCGAHNCCSQYNTCGDTTAHCGVGCQVGFGNCTDSTTVSPAASWQTALKKGIADTKLGGQYYWDSKANYFWTWDTPEFIAEKLTKIVKARGLAGVMAWSLGEDTYDNSHMLALQKGVNELNASNGTCSMGANGRARRSRGT